MAFQVESASLVSLFVETLLYGAFLIILVISCRIIKERLRDRPEARPVIIKLSVVLALMFLLATIHVGTSLHRILDVFVSLHDHSQTSQRLNQINNAGYITQIFTYGLQTLIGDGFMIYRMYIVWDRWKAVCAPVALLFVASTGAGITCIVTSTQQTDVDLSSPGRSRWAITFFWLTLLTNTLATSLIAGRLLVLHRRITTLLPAATRHPQSKRSHTAAVVIIESGAVYSFCLILLIGLYMNGTYAQVIVLDAMPQIMGINFSLVILRVALGVSREGQGAKSMDGPEISGTFLFPGDRPPNVSRESSMYSKQGQGFITVEVVQTTDA